MRSFAVLHPDGFELFSFRGGELFQQYFGDQDIGFDDQLIRAILLYFANAIAHAGAPAAIGRKWCNVQSFWAVFDGIHMVDVFFQGRAE